LGGCSSLNGDFGRVRPSLVSDDMHAWIGRDAATNVGAPVSLYNLTDDERELRDRAYPLIAPPYERYRWDAVLSEYGLTRRIQKRWWYFDRTAYYRHLMELQLRSTTARYARLVDDARNDVERIWPFFANARRVVDLDRKREQSFGYIPDLDEAERVNALARIN